MPSAANKNETTPPFASLWTGSPIDLAQVLDARERRVFRQMDLLARYGKPLICFTMNIAGPIKSNPLIRRGFLIGLEDLKLQLVRAGIELLFEATLSDPTGNEAYLVADADAITLKKLAAELEDRNGLGRLFDMDVLILPEGDALSPLKIDRQAIALPMRTCLICQGPAKACASRRIHTVRDLQEKTAEILYKACLSRSADAIAEYAVRSLLYEVSTTPKPGLVDRANTGSHRDMDFYSFMSSSAALWPYFRTCAAIGQDTAFLPPEETFRLLRQPGKQAENRMLRATGGVNTHKGAVFTLGIVAAAAARLDTAAISGHTEAACPKNTERPPEVSLDASGILAECARMTRGLTAHDFASVTRENAATTGQRLYAEYGITGVRGQMEAGLPAVAHYGLPLLIRLLAEGRSKDEAGAAVLLAMMAHTTDTNLIHRSSRGRQEAAARQALDLLSAAKDECPKAEDIRQLDAVFISENLSPGGSADLLAVCWFLYTLTTEGL